MRNNFFISIEIPLNNWTGYSGRESYQNTIRIKELPSLRQKLAQENFTNSHYVEWQIHCKDVLANGDLANIFYQYCKCGVITKQEVCDLLNDIEQCHINNFIESILFSEVGIPYTRGNNSPTFINKYPTIRLYFGNFWLETSLEKRGYASGVQPMLYVCFPITELIPDSNNPILLGRVAEQKEKAHLILDATHKAFLLESLKIFGILSQNHNHDIREILGVIKAQIP